MNSYTEERLREALRVEANERFAALVAEWRESGARPVDALPRTVDLIADNEGNIEGEVKYFFTLPNGKPWTPHATLRYRPARGQEKESWSLAYASWEYN